MLLSWSLRRDLPATCSVCDNDILPYHKRGYLMKKDSEGKVVTMFCVCNKQCATQMDSNHTELRDVNSF